MFDDYKKSGIIHKIIQNQLITNFNKFTTSLDIVIFIEDQIKQLTKFDENNPLHNGIAFPVGISINDVAAHFTPSIENNPIIMKDDVIKIDFGIHINGHITDGAISICPSGKYNELIEISKNATELAIKNSGPDVILGEIGGIIQEYIESKEIEIGGKNLPIKSIYDLCGHNIQRYLIHANKAVPNIKINYQERMLEGEVFAIETFPTTGNGSIYELKECNHYMIEPKDFTNIQNAIKFDNNLKKIYDIRRSLAFCPRWFDFDINKCNYITKYPVLKTTDGGIVSQYEKTIFIKDNGCEILN